jgi:hypothetical protein
MRSLLLSMNRNPLVESFLEFIDLTETESNENLSVCPEGAVKAFAVDIQKVLVTKAVVQVTALEEVARAADEKEDEVRVSVKRRRPLPALPIVKNEKKAVKAVINHKPAYMRELGWWKIKTPTARERWD